MGLEVVVNEIIEQGRKQANDIKVEGLEEAKAILEEARSKAEGIIADKAKDAQRDADRLKAQERARAEFEAKKKVLYAKRALWDRLRAEAEEALRTLPDATRRAHLQALLGRAEQQVGTGTAHVVAQDVEAARGLTKLTVEGDLVGLGGVVVDSAEGDLSLDLRYEALIESAWPSVLKEESKRLFG